MEVFVFQHSVVAHDEAEARDILAEIVMSDGPIEFAFNEQIVLKRPAVKGEDYEEDYE